MALVEFTQTFVYSYLLVFLIGGVAEVCPILQAWRKKSVPLSHFKELAGMQRCAGPMQLV